jgi:iron complex transport system ATP-binding protein
MGFALEQVTFRYPQKTVIRKLSFCLQPGRTYGILGPNGCGKTTLLDLLVRHRKPCNGCIRYEGRKLSTYRQKDLARKVALVPQNYDINFPFTAGQIVMMGRYPHMTRFCAPSTKDQEMVQDIMQKTDTAEFAHRPVTELSGGERQRVVLARALAQDARMLILDEAFSNLDVQHCIQLLNTVTRLSREKGTGVIAVFHDINLAARYCDELIFMDNGQIVASGPRDLVLNPEILQKVFKVQARVYFEPFSQASQVAFKQTGLA